MQRISKKYKVPKEQKIFITFIISFFSVLCVSIFGYIVINIAGEVSETVSSGAEKTVNNYSQPLIQSLINTFSGLNISVFGSILSIILLISGYFFFEMSKQSKTKLSS
jgi:flagellar basal body-associated protein FliL